MKESRCVYWKTLIQNKPHPSENFSIIFQLVHTPLKNTILNTVIQFYKDMNKKSCNDQHQRESLNKYYRMMGKVISDCLRCVIDRHREEIIRSKINFSSQRICIYEDSLYSYCLANFQCSDIGYFQNSLKFLKVINYQVTLNCILKVEIYQCQIIQSKQLSCEPDEFELPKKRQVAFLLIRVGGSFVIFSCILQSQPLVISNG